MPSVVSPVQGLDPCTCLHHLLRLLLSGMSIHACGTGIWHCGQYIAIHDDLAMGVQVIDRLLTRLGSSDCMETSSSSFLVEMQARPDVHLGG
jgi:hypothetical protein